MPTEQQHGQPPAAPAGAADAFIPIIRQQVQAALGGTPGGQVVRVRALWGKHYRANVFLDENPLDGHITRSYFLVIDDDGTITHSSPALPR